MGKRHIYVISDLHLGGAPPEQTDQGETAGFQMCPPQSRRRLARFIHHVRSAHPGEPTELVINGDFVDFLAEEAVEGSPAPPAAIAGQFAAFTADPSLAVRKFRRVVRRTDEEAPPGERVFEALRDFVGQGHTLTILLGNHDLELSIPAVRHALMEILTQGRPACVEFLYDGEAYVQGDLLIEHGNRYDGWNAVAYGVLRAYRSALSRNEPQQIQFVPPPGSRLVTEIMNRLKKDYKFIDLLKPENEALIPVLAALAPDVVPYLKKIVFLLGLGAEKRALELEPGGVPVDAMHIADGQSTAVAKAEGFSPFVLGDPVAQETIAKSHELLAQAEAEWAAESEAGEETHIAEGQPGLKQRVRGGLAILNQLLPFSHNTYAKLRKSLLSYRETIGATFDWTSESPRYLKAAARLAEGRRIVVFGHTHLAKRRTLETGGLYLNSGTWCPTIQLPTDLYSPEKSDVLPAIKQFLEALANNRMEEPWYQLRTTFVKITIEGDTTRGELFQFHEDGVIEPIGGSNGA